MANMWSDPKERARRLSEFLLQFGPPDEADAPDPEALVALVAAWNQAAGGEDLREKD